MNLDRQLLLLSMGAHKRALQLLRLPFTAEAVRPAELETRSVLHASCRLLKAMSTDCPKMQLELVPSLPTFVELTQASLVAHDVSPTACVIAIFKDNHAVCAQVEESTVRRFVELAAEENAPRFLRFLRGVMCPANKPIKRNQTLVLNCLNDKEAALLLFNNNVGRERRSMLIEREDHLRDPRSRLVCTC
jgi:hypothetical protein